jgi:ATP-dependent protease ClpP protease subunit
MSKFWSFIKNQATGTQEESVELRISGDIVNDDDTWIYEWFGIAVASPNAFRNELSQYKGQNITVWIDSYGGDVFAAAGIYNALMEHKNTGVKVTCKIDGKAMSAASVIAMAGDEILMSPVSIMMIHNPLSQVQGYASDMRKAADVLDTVKETIINAYVAKTGRSESEVSDMMDQESWMSANEAVKQGFADGVLYLQQNKDENQNVMNFAFNRISIQNSLNEAIKHFLTFEKNNKLKNAQEKCQCSECSQSEEDCKCAECGLCSGCCDNPNCCGCNCDEEGCSKSNVSNCRNIIIKNKEESIVDLKELKNKYPDIYKAAYEEGREDGIKNEQERLKAIDEIGNNLDPELVNKAKYVEPMNAEKLAFEAIKNDAAKGTQMLNSRKEEIKNSGTEKVITNNNDIGKEEEEEKNAINNLAKFMNKKRGGER